MAKAKQGDTVRVHYTGTLADGVGEQELRWSSWPSVRENAG